MPEHRKDVVIVSDCRKLREELKDQSVLNANVLVYLREHPELIPENWKGKKVFFLGTIFRDTGGRPGICYLNWSDWSRSQSFGDLKGAWLSRSRALDGNYFWDSSTPAAVLVR